MSCTSVVVSENDSRASMLKMFISGFQNGFPSRFFVVCPDHGSLVDWVCRREMEGILCLNIDTFLDGTHNREREVAWRLNLFARFGSRNVLVSSSSALLKDATKAGFVTVFVGSDSFVSSWVAVRLDSLDDLTPYVTKVVSNYCAAGVSSLSIPVNAWKEFGDCLRSHIISYCRLKRLRFVGFGSELESVDACTLAGVRQLHYNPGVLPPYVVSHRFGLLGEIPDASGDGQKKLDAVDFPMLSLASNVILIGGSPGNHFSKYKNHSFFVVDPRPHAIEGKVRQKKALWDLDRSPFNSEYVVIIDIRRDRDGASDEEWEVMVAEDNAIMECALSFYRQDRLCVGFSMKWRPSRSGPSPVIDTNCQVVLQPWVWSRSAEMRRMYDWRFSRDAKFSVYDKHTHFAAAEGWNRARYVDSSLELDQTRRLASMFFIRARAQSHVPLQNDLTVALFSISNMVNVRDETPSGRFVALYPLDQFFRFSNLSGVDYGGKAITSQIGEEVFNDWTSDPTLFVDSFSCKDFLAALKSIGCSGSGCSSEGLPNAWFFRTNEVIMPTGQNWLSSQTIYVKFITAEIRRIWGLDKSSLYADRRAVIQRLGGVPVDDALINGYFLRAGRRDYVSISGHLINLLLFSQVGCVSLPRYFDTVEDNLNYVSGAPSEYASIVREGEFSELATGMWHSYDDYLYAIDAYDSLVRRIGWNPLTDEISLYIKKRLASLARSYPIFRTLGQSSVEYARKWSL